MNNDLAGASPVDRMVEALPPQDVRCCFNCTKWHKKGYIHCQCSGPWGGDIFGDKNCTFRAKKVRSNVKLTSSPALSASPSGLPGSTPATRKDIFPRLRERNNRWR